MTVRALAVGACAAIVAAAFAATPAGSVTSTATLGPNVAEFLDAARPAEKLDAIVAFHDDAGFDRLASLDVAFDRTRSVPIAFALLTAPQAREIASWPETRSVYENEEVPLDLDEGTRMVNADDVWRGDGLARPYLGTGVGVAVLDTGCDATHPDLPLGTKVKKNFYVAGSPLNGTSSPTIAFVEGVQTDTEHGHGTHVAGTIAGTGAASGGRYQGVAPGADLYCFKVGAGASVLTAWAIRAFDWIIVNGDALNIRVASNSWGGGGGSDYQPNDPVNIITKAAYEDDIVVVFSAGNSGGPNKLGRNAVSPYVVSVAAANKDFTKASFSSTGRPGGDWIRDANGLYRPTVTAPGVDIMAPRSSAGVVMSTGVDPTNPYYTSASGTSMSAPHVSGVVALVLEANPSLTAQNVIDVLEGTARDMPAYEVWEVGAGFVDAHRAAMAAEDGQVAFKPLTKGRVPTYVLRTGASFEGDAIPAGYTLKSVDPSLVDRIPVSVGSGVEAIFAEISWPRATDNVYLYLFDPSGREVASSAGLLDVGSVNHRTVVVTNPAQGTWTIGVEGRVNLPTEYSGFWGLYDENTKKQKAFSGRTTTTTSEMSGVAGPGVDAAHTSAFHPVNVPAGATNVSVRIDWDDPTFDLDLYVYDATGKLVGQSLGTWTETNWEETYVTTGDPMGGGLVAGEWTVEVRSYVSVATPYTGTVRVTAAS